MTFKSLELKQVRSQLSVKS